MLTVRDIANVFSMVTFITIVDYQTQDIIRRCWIGNLSEELKDRVLYKRARVMKEDDIRVEVY